MKKNMQKEILATQVRGKISTYARVLLSSVILVIALPLFTAFMFMLIASSIHTFSIATLVEGNDYGFQIQTTGRFDELAIPKTLFENLMGVGRRGPYMRILIPRSPYIEAFCKKKNCPATAMFLKSDDELSIVKRVYPEAFGAINSDGWEALVYGPSKIFQPCLVQKMRQADPARPYSFECAGAGYEEALFAYQKIMENFSIGNLSYAPLVDDEAEMQRVGAWSRGVFSIFYESLWLPKIDSYEKLVWLTGYDLKDLSSYRPLLFILPKYPEVNAYCEPMKASGLNCIEEPIFAGEVNLWHHASWFSFASPGQVSGTSFENLIDPVNGYYAHGSITQFAGEDFYIFQLNNVQDPASIKKYYDVLKENFQAGELAYHPTDNAAVARLWQDPGFPIYISETENTLSYALYTDGVAFGRVRLLDAAGTAGLENSTDYGFQDILVLETSPFDIQSPVAAVITQVPQSTGASHLALRMERRGTPNAYIQDALSAFSPYNGQLVKITIMPTGYKIDNTVTAQEADAWWIASRPHLQPPEPVDVTYDHLDRLVEMNDTPTQRITKYGGKAAGLSKVYEFLPQEYQIQGFGIPFHYFYDFIRMNDIHDPTLPTVGGKYQHSTFEQYYLNLLNFPKFQTDPKYRAGALAALVAEGEDNNSGVPVDAYDTILQRVRELWNANDQGYYRDNPAVPVSVRFRSSSNMEDALEFNGAGLYNSVTFCLADELDSDSIGPSKCNAAEPKERGLSRAMRRVWISAFASRAFEEREYYQLPQERIAMAILVNTATPDERANGVALTGYTDWPQNDSRYVQYTITTNFGEESIVNPNPDIHPEIDIVQIDKETNMVNGIFRSQGSSLATPENPVVLSDEELGQLGAVMRLIEMQYPFDLEGYPRENILSDIEFKFTVQGGLIIKQHRPFLIGTPKSFIAIGAMPEKPAGVYLESLEKQTPKFTWTNGSQNASQIVIERRYNSGNFVPIATLDKNATEFIDTEFSETAITYARLYSYRVIAENAWGKSDPSDSIAVMYPIMPMFIRGDANRDGKADLADSVFTLGYLYLSDPNIDARATCLEAMDVNGSGEITINDPVSLLNFLFSGGERPKNPYPGADILRIPSAFGCQK